MIKLNINKNILKYWILCLIVIGIISLFFLWNNNKIKKNIDNPIIKEKTIETNTIVNKEKWNNNIVVVETNISYEDFKKKEEVEKTPLIITPDSTKKEEVEKFSKEIYEPVFQKIKWKIPTQDLLKNKEKVYYSIYKLDKYLRSNSWNSLENLSEEQLISWINFIIEEENLWLKTLK